MLCFMRIHRPSFHDVVNCLSHPLDKKGSNLSRLLRIRQATRAFHSQLFSIAEENCPIIGTHPCLGSILNVFYKYVVNAATTAINTCKHYLILVKGR